MIGFLACFAFRYSSSPRTLIREVFAQIRKTNLPRAPTTLQRNFSHTDIFVYYITNRPGREYQTGYSSNSFPAMMIMGNLSMSSLSLRFLAQINNVSGGKTKEAESDSVGDRKRPGWKAQR